MPKSESQDAAQTPLTVVCNEVDTFPEAMP
jgi:hypothetical protein